MLSCGCISVNPQNQICCICLHQYAIIHGVRGVVGMIELYKNIKNRRIELGMTQTELAQKVGYADKGMISRVENGKVDLSQSQIIKFLALQIKAL
jgi:DNA-binding XRE family transcriptional regulator